MDKKWTSIEVLLKNMYYNRLLKFAYKSAKKSPQSPHEEKIFVPEWSHEISVSKKQ